MSERADEMRLRTRTARLVFQGGPAARLAAGKAFGVPFPETACRASVLGERAVLWLGPDEHLLLAPDGSQERILAELDSALSGIAHSLVDVSHRQVAIAVAGRAARNVLASGCPLDLDSAAFPVGMCTRTLFGKAEALLWRPSAEEYHLEVGRSFADYVRGCLREAQ